MKSMQFHSSVNDSKISNEKIISSRAVVRRRQFGSSQSGFTLIEIMVVIVILALMAFLVVPNIVGQSDKARKKTTQITLSSISNVLDQYRVDNGHYPTTVQGLEVLSTPPAEAKNYPEGGYIKGGYPIDGWENELQYVSPGSEGRPYDLFSLGADKKVGGEDLNADIYAQL
ncbi:type II secretion system major pseudopilin GspG [Psychrobacter sp. 1U1]|uniref:type II secretion system major pseudopilin GspG n=1 Tax=Psychrobacter sp. 1U1 TaxID=3453576 RepID=UPI003F47466C